MTTPNSGSPHSANARQLLQDLQDKFPVMRDCRPLAIGIDKQLLARLPDVDRKHLRIALGIHTHSLRYLKALEKAQVRLDLEGNPAGEVTPEQRVYAGGLVKERLERRTGQGEVGKAGGTAPGAARSRRAGAATCGKAWPSG